MSTRTTRRTRRTRRAPEADAAVEEDAPKATRKTARADRAERARLQKEKEERAAAEKAERIAAKEAARQAKIAEVQAAKQELIDSGKLIETDGAEYHLVERDETPTVEQRAIDALAYLRENATEKPVRGKDLQDEFGGGWPQWLSFFAMLKAAGLVREYRMRTGARGGGGISYLYIGD